MNRERLLGIAHWLDGGAIHEKVSFNMADGIIIREAQEFNSSQVATCQTACCIAGAAVQFYDHPENMDVRDTSNDMHGELRTVEERDFRPGKNIAINWKQVKREATSLLDISEHEAAALFTPTGMEGAYVNTPWVAAAVIRHFVATGRVEWYAEHITERAKAYGLRY